MDTSDLNFQDDANLILSLFKNETDPIRRFHLVSDATRAFAFNRQLPTSDQCRRAQYLITFILRLGIEEDARLRCRSGAAELFADALLEFIMPLDAECDPAKTFDSFTPVSLLTYDCSNWACTVTTWLLCELFPLFLCKKKAVRRFARKVIWIVTLNRVLPCVTVGRPSQRTRCAWLSCWLDALLTDMQLALKKADEVNSRSMAFNIFTQFAGIDSPVSRVMIDVIRDLDHNDIVALVTNFLAFWRKLQSKLKSHRLARHINRILSRVSVSLECFMIRFFRKC